MSQIKRGELNATTQRRKVPTVTRDQIQDNASLFIMNLSLI